MIHHSRPMVLATALPAFVLFLAVAACNSSGQQNVPDAPDREIRPIEELVEATKKPDSIGKFLVDVSSAITAWNNLTLAATTEAEKSRARLVETHLSTVTHQRRAELITELEKGPLNNRQVAATALGFTHDVEAQSPLIAALADPHDEVVGNALLGLWLLGRADTPLDKICPLLGNMNSEKVRSNAALLMASLTEKGARDACVLPSARIAVLDTSASVRTHAVYILANCADADSLQALLDRLYDDTTIVVSAAGRALTYLARQEPRVKGPAARGLVKCWIAARDEAKKSAMFRNMVDMAAANFGSDEKEWAKWADRLP